MTFTPTLAEILLLVCCDFFNQNFFCEIFSLENWKQILIKISWRQTNKNYKVKNNPIENFAINLDGLIAFILHEIHIFSFFPICKSVLFQFVVNFMVLY